MGVGDLFFRFSDSTLRFSGRAAHLAGLLGRYAWLARAAEGFPNIHLVFGTPPFFYARIFSGSAANGPLQFRTAAAVDARRDDDLPSQRCGPPRVVPAADLE